MHLYLGASSYEIYPSLRTRDAWNVNITADRFDLLRFRKVQSPHGCCVMADVTESEAREWVAANPIANPKGWTRLSDVLAHYAFSFRFRLGLAG